MTKKTLPATQPAPAALSALDSWFDVCRTGTHTDMNNTTFTLSEGDLARIAAAYATSDPAPVVVGHPETDAPAWGWVDGLRVVGDTLQAKLTRLDDAFRAAVEAGRYAGRSVAIDRDDTGGWSLRHIGFLGGVAPAVQGLSPAMFRAPATAPAATLELTVPLGGTEERSAWSTTARALRGLREWIIERSSIEQADRILPGWGLTEIQALGEPEDGDFLASLASRFTQETSIMPNTPAAPAAAIPDLSTGWMTGTSNNIPAAAAAAIPDPAQVPDPAAITAAAPNPPADPGLAREQAALAAERAQLATERLQLAAQRCLSEAHERVGAHVSAGRVLPAEAASLEALFAALSGQAASIRLAGSATPQTPGDALQAFLSGLPVRGPDTAEYAGPGQIAMSGAQAPVMRDGQTAQHVALAAKALMGSDPTGTMTIADAVRQVTEGGR